MSVQGVYVAYPIDQRSPDPTGYDWMLFFDAVEFFEENVIQSGSAGWTFDPGDAFKVSRGAMIDDTLPRINRTALSNADVVVAFLPKGVASVGVPIEVDRALRLGKPVILFSDADAWMLHDARIRRYPDWSESNMEDAIDYIAGLQVEESRRNPDPLYVVDENPGGWATPTRAYRDDAGWDLYVNQEVVIAPGSFCDVPCGLRVALPPWSWGLVTGRSSALRKHGLLVHSGVIDAGYRGPLYAGAFNLTQEAVRIKVGERIAQLIVIPNGTLNTEVQLVDALPVSERGENGFGSSGR